MEGEHAKISPSEILRSDKESVQRDLAWRLAKRGQTSTLSSFVGYGPQAFLLYGVVPEHYLWGWLGLVVAAEAVNASLSFALQRWVDQPARRERTWRALMAGWGVSGTLWGSVVLLPGVTASVDVLLPQLLFLAVIALASIHVCSVRPACVAAFTGGILGPIVWSAVVEHGVPFPFGLGAVGLFVICQVYGGISCKLVLESIAADLTIRLRKAELRKAKEAAEESNRAKSVFLSNMSHELRTPLNAILGYTQLLSPQQNLTERQRQQLGIMHASGEHLLTLIGDILDLSKIEAQKMELTAAPFFLPRLLQQVVEISRPRANQKCLDLRYEPDPRLPQWVLGDESRVRQILLNLLANAVKFTPKGCVTLSANYDSSSGTLLCEVSDTGIGIPEDKLDTIFEPFAQLAPDAQGREGAGLGLTITKRLASLMDGDVTVASRIGEGSRFRFSATLPIAQPIEPTAEPTWQRIRGYQGERKRILVVDDNPANAALLVDLLTALGFDVKTAENGRQAIALALAAPWPHLVLMDLAMPELDGLDTVREFRRHRELADIPMVGVSATVTDSERKQQFVEECGAFLGKPVQIDELLQTVGALLDLEWITVDGATEKAIVILTPAMLAQLPSPLLAEVHHAALSLDGERISALMPQIRAIDATLAASLFDLINHFDYQSILNAINGAGSRAA